MSDVFLVAVRVRTTEEALRNSLRAALQRNKVYHETSPKVWRAAFRRAWSSALIAAAEQYKDRVSDAEHCANIGGISLAMSSEYGSILDDGRLRFGTSQKALNLFLKFEWRLGHLPVPPHCPVDGVVLRAAGLTGSWTRSDSEDEYMRWIGDLRAATGDKNLAEWEYETWKPTSRK